MSESSIFNVGDVVALRSGGPGMTIYSISEPDKGKRNCGVQWFSGNELKTSEFSEMELVDKEQVEDLVDRMAIMMAIGNNGGEWATHYTDEQKLTWQRRAADIIHGIAAVLDARQFTEMGVGK